MSLRLRPQPARPALGGSSPLPSPPLSLPACLPQEYVNGQLKNKYGDCFIRGNNVLYISTSKS